jgi:hypothetical protein
MKLQRNKAAAVGRAGQYAVSPTQRDLFLAHEREPASTTYSLGVSVPLPRRVDVPRWAHACALVIDSEPALRSRFGMSAGDVVGWAGEGPRDAVVELDGVGAVAGFVKTPYDLGAGPLVRPALVRRAGLPQVAVVAAHHIVMDAAGGALLLARLWDTYRALEAGGPPPLPGGEPFAAYVDESRRIFDTPAVEAMWTERLTGTVPLVARPTAGEPMCVSHALLEPAPDAPVRVAAARVLAAYAYALSTTLRPAGRFVIHDLANSRRAAYRATIGCLYQVIPVVFPPPGGAPSPPARWLEYALTYRASLGDHRHISVSRQRRLGPCEGVRFHFNFYAFDRVELSGASSIVDVLDSFPTDEAHLLAKPRPDGIRLELHHPRSVDGAHLLDAVVSTAALLHRTVLR